ncbi:MAG: NRDE family protein [Sinobacteraceae bacterium]|nr:NRDE family protein [Nevskiaceae bacterium]
MCLIVVGWKAHPQLALAIAANRDEYHARPTAPAAAWAEAPHIVGGRDLKEGGGWLALETARGRLAAVTNFRTARPPQAARSRGHLVRDFLLADAGAADYAERLSARAGAYRPFNLLLWDGRELVRLTNRPVATWTRLVPGLHAVANGPFDRDEAKSRRVTGALRDWLLHYDARREAQIDPLLAALADERPAADGELPADGMGAELERFLSPPFIRDARYGTRASSVVLVETSGRALFFERRFGPDGVAAGDTRLLLHLPCAAPAAPLAPGVPA